MKKVPGGVTAAKGFVAHGMSCGIKKSGKKDLALIFSEVPCAAAGVFTSNKVHASCVDVNGLHLRDGKAQAIIVNSGNANCMTGKRGAEDSKKMAVYAAKQLQLSVDDVLVASTGVIGHPLPIEKIEAAVPALVAGLGEKGSPDAARAIMTTDKTVKETAVTCIIGGKPVRIGAIAKGAGMIHPEMSLRGASAKSSGGPKHATMLCFATTDAAISPAALRAALAEAVGPTFNMITVDGDMSTNDMVLVLANGLAGNKPIVKGSKDYQMFVSALREIFLHLAQSMVRDAEGATKFVSITVRGARSEADARIAARGVATSNLFKCALFGSDPNWGRIAAAAGHSGADIDPGKLKLYFGRMLAVKNGGPVAGQTPALERIFAQKNIEVTLDLGLGKHSATAYTCDLTTKYVELNSAYHT